MHNSEPNITEQNSIASFSFDVLRRYHDTIYGRFYHHFFSVNIVFFTILLIFTTLAYLLFVGISFFKYFDINLGGFHIVIILYIISGSFDID